MGLDAAFNMPVVTIFRLGWVAIHPNLLGSWPIPHQCLLHSVEQHSLSTDEKYGDETLVEVVSFL